jgi:hypothetical protein
MYISIFFRFRYFPNNLLTIFQKKQMKLAAKEMILLKAKYVEGWIFTD